jgi:two-component system chemotaxis sensor kinase CheA
MDFQVSPELLAIFLEDARGHLEILDQTLLGLEREEAGPEAAAAVLGPLHTLKGNSGMLGFAGIKDYVHRLEDVFARIRDSGIALTAALFDRLFTGASALRAAVEDAGARGAEGVPLAAEQAALEALLAVEFAAAPAAAAPPAVPAASLTPPVPALRPSLTVNPPSPQGLAPVEPAEAPKGQRRADAQYVAVRSSMVRVDFAQLDHLLNLVGELIIYRTKLQELGRETALLLGGHERAQELVDAVQHIGGVSTQLQETIMDVRMLPIRHVFERFPRMVRDLARQQGKEIELILEGEATRVDKAIIDEIGEPLVHMIRNSVDHGIESPAARLARGKTSTGTILLSAAQESNHVVITIMDDGAGIDAGKVREVAVQRGILRPDEVLNEREALQLIFSEGFSTAAAVTDVSGRGVGMDVVLKAIERLSGLVEAESIPGVGTKFIIQLPLTLAIISALLVDVAGRTYALPLASVVESLRYKRAEITRMSGAETLRIRERIVPLVHLADLFGFERDKGAEQPYAVILGRSEKRLAVSVDRLRGQQEIVIKALDASISGGQAPVAGATIMGDGRVVLILDVAALFEGKRHTEGLRPLAAGAKA